jgi:hypothetical protein
LAQNDGGWKDVDDGGWKDVAPPPAAAPSEPDQPSLVSRIANAPSNIVGKVGDWASGKSQRDQEENLSAAARGEEPPNSVVKDYGVGVLGDTAKLASGILKPGNVAQIGAAAVAPEVMLPYFAYKGSEAALTPRQEGESTPDEIQRRLLGASQAVGSVAGAAAAPKTLTERAAAVAPTKEGIGRTFRTEEGRGPIKPIVSKLSRVAGGYVGSHAGPLGTAAGVYGGPSIADAVIPRAPAPIPPPEGQLPARPNIGPVEGPAAAQAWTPLNRTPPNAAGQVERVGVQHNPEQAVIAPRQPGRTIGDRLLPPGPAEAGQTTSVLTPPATEPGKTAAPTPPAETAKLTPQQVLEAQRQIAQLRRSAAQWSEKMSSARNWRKANEYMRNQQYAEEQASRIEEGLGNQKAVGRTVTGATKEELTATYNGLSNEDKISVEQLLDEYGYLNSGEKTRFEQEHNMGSALMKGLPAKEKLARYVTEHRGAAQPTAEPEPVGQVAAVAGSPARNAQLEQPNAGPRIATPSRNETMTENLKNRVPGSNPLEPRTPLAKQPPPQDRTPAQVKEETVHPMDRQFVHVNGAQAFERTAGTPETRTDLLNLENDQLREVLRKSGEDMGTKRVGSSGKTADPNDYTRPEAFDILFEKGYTPERIVKEAPPRSKPAPNRVPFGPPR